MTSFAYWSPLLNKYLLYHSTKCGNVKNRNNFFIYHSYTFTGDKETG